MSFDQQQQPISLWESINVNEVTAEKIDFAINELHIVDFPVGFSKPEERPSEFKDASPYCIFRVLENGNDKVIMTSAYTLLKGLKKLEPLSGKKVKIVKKLVKGKSQFIVSEVD